MDQVHLPDPVLDDIKVLQQENTELTNRVLELEKELKYVINDREKSDGKKIDRIVE